MRGITDGAPGKILDFVLPPRCVVSGVPVEKQGMLAPEVWADLDFITSPMCQCCGRPFDFEQFEDSLCGECLARRPYFSSARSVMVYDEASRGIVLRFKHADQTHAVVSFIPWLKRAGAKMLSEADFIVPVPLHRWRLLYRRYNQAAIIAKALSRETAAAFAPEALGRVRHTPSQGHKGARDRKKNVRGAFAVSPQWKPLIKSKNIVLVDDVYTTGATVNECSRALLKAGCARVDVLTLARAVKPGQIF